MSDSLDEHDYVGRCAGARAISPPSDERSLGAELSYPRVLTTFAKQTG
jgi:hypothetical protein